MVVSKSAARTARGGSCADGGSSSSSSSSFWHHSLSLVQSLVMITVFLLSSLPHCAPASLWGGSPSASPSTDLAAISGLGSTTTSKRHTGGAACLFERSLNDDYCDCIDGSDETSTSACSGSSLGLGRTVINNFNRRTSFKCPNGVLNVTIPYSRLQDGVCDCCDGADEVDSPFKEFVVPGGREAGKRLSSCPDTCSDAIMDLQVRIRVVYTYIHLSHAHACMYVCMYRMMKLCYCSPAIVIIIALTYVHYYRYLCTCNIWHTYSG